MNYINIITAKNNSIGYGHYSRCSVLEKFFLKKKIKCKLFVNLNKNKIIKILRQGDLNIIDLPNIKDNFIKKNIKENQKTIFLDYYGNFNFKNNFIIFNHSLKKRRYSLSNTIINQNLISIKKKKKKNKYIKKILIILGAYDKKNYLVKILKKLKSSKVYIYVITKNKKHLGMSNKKIHIIFDKLNFYKYFNIADLVISNTGMSCLESLYLKKLTISLPQTKKESKFSKYLLKKNYIYGNRLDSIDRLLKKNLLIPNKNLSFAKIGLGQNKIYNKIIEIYDKKNKN